MATQDRDGATEVVRALHRSFNERDEDALRGHLADDVRWHVPGDNPMAGDYDGRDEVWAGLFQPLWPSPARFEDDRLVEHGEHVIALGQQVHDFGEGEQAWPTVEVLRVRDGLVEERWEFADDQATLDRFLTRGCAAVLGDLPDEAPTTP